MENRAHALIAGLFVVAMSLGLMGALWWFSEGRETTRSYELCSRGNITGLNLQAQVRYRGMQAGRVGEILVDPEDPRNILVRIQLRSDIALTRGTRASLGTQGVTGLAFILLEDAGQDPRPLVGKNGQAPRIELQPGTLELITANTMEAMARFRTLSEQLNKLTDEQSIASLKTTLARLESAAGGLEETLKDGPETLAAIRAALSPENVAALRHTLRNLEQASEQSGPALDEFRRLLATLDATGRRLDGLVAGGSNSLNGEILPAANDLITELGTTSRRMNALLEQLQRSPQVLVRGRAVRRAGPGEAGFEEEGSAQ